MTDHGAELTITDRDEADALDRRIRDGETLARSLREATKEGLAEAAGDIGSDLPGDLRTI